MVTEGATRAEALARASDALVTALSFYVDENRALPRPSPAHGRPIVAVPTLEAAKLALHEAMLAAGISNVELARKLGSDEKSVRRLRDPLHGSRIEAVEAALHALGRRIEVTVASERQALWPETGQKKGRGVSRAPISAPLPLCGPGGLSRHNAAISCSR
jgi:antitoxin HicB